MLDVQVGVWYPTDMRNEFQGDVEIAHNNNLFIFNVSWEARTHSYPGSFDVDLVDVYSDEGEDLIDEYKQYLMEEYYENQRVLLHELILEEIAEMGYYDL